MSMTASAETAPMHHKLHKLELHVTHACNLACESCSHYSNHGHKGHVSLDEADAWMSAWSHRLDVDRFSLLGGEPTIHPEFSKFIPLSRRHWPRAKLELVTNGFFLTRHPDLPKVMREAGNATLFLSIHHDDPAYLARVEKPLALLREWKSQYGISVIIRPAFKKWTQRYTGFGKTMMPFADENPRASWNICQARTSQQLLDGKIYKCAPLAYLPMQKQKYDLDTAWDPYLAYEALAPDCSDAALADFIRLEDESVCAMCSAVERTFELKNPMHRATV